ncbi:unnamed protein product [Rotaria socialis]|uniref:G-protein coupled receptors family 1 profile domain-containing protein n=1 Tax=Rotaria socialis TaxID=392032 RepID=A0A818ZKU0_9BILA|nr:unnamed protein product [Rotaria socialis]CAF3503678.1 unnamed protein product [Rotaria socialis]CAF3768870.1 unnamed protein product [Rotaria socialis]CAF4263503.1 unnamed protein product [Rotaria socialis]CAF4431979.1 unnamed protein product [Rotaria socialis]
MNNYTIIPSNQSDNNWDDNDNDNGPSLHIRIAFACAWIFIAVSGIIGNSLVISVAVRFQKLNNVTNCFIVNLAITDIVFLAFCMPLLVVQYTLDIWLFNEVFCKLLNFISFISVLVTVLTLVAMTIDRYIYVVRPFENLKWRKPRTVLLLSIIIWFISCMFALPFYYHYGLSNHDNNYQCVLLSDEELQKYLGIYTITLYYFIPLIIIIISYAKLLYYVYSKENKLQTHTKLTTSKKSKKRRTVTKMVAVVTLIFSLCWLPITLYIILAYIFPRKSIFLYYYKIIANSLAYLNSAVNPILYAFLNRSFRNNCGSLFFQRSCSETIRDEHHQSRTKCQQPLRRHQASTQIDRFSYQSTNNQSSSSTRDKNMKQISRLTNNKNLSSPIIVYNDYLDGKHEKIDDESLSKVSSQQYTPQDYHCKGKYEEISTDETNVSTILTTNL